jgi:hypothetical protein
MIPSRRRRRWIGGKLGCCFASASGSEDDALKIAEGGQQSAPDWQRVEDNAFHVQADFL